MEIQKTTGIVLSSVTLGEADKIARIYTKEYGKRNFIFKGIKKSKRRPITVAEPGTISKLVYYFHEDKDIYLVNEFQIFKQYFAIRNNFKKIVVLYFLLETAEKTSAYNDPNRSIFDLIVAGIDNLVKTEYLEHFSVFFILHILRLNGILPDLNICKMCHRHDYDEFAIDLTDFYPICRNCSNSMKNNKMLFHMRIKEYIDLVLLQKYVSINHSLFPVEDILNLLFYLILFIESYFHVEIKSKNFILQKHY
ncbi:MAG: DNA repair protein RecO [Spirochaetota bacterium]|nr:DNA repair protein RecO [Spirochaetota bacterium]